LEREGLVAFTATGRAFVSDLTPKDYEELFIMRLALEPLAVRLAVPHLRNDLSALLTNIVDTSRATSLQQVTAFDLAFHDLLVSASDNSRLTRLWRSLRWELDMWLGRLHRMHERKTKSVREETVRAHSHLVELIRTRTPAACEQEVRQHILSWKVWLPTDAANQVPPDRDRN
jgi:DNA-binding GntR family transcriptional regulator